MSNQNMFSRKIKDLARTDIEYTEDFFRRAFGEESATTTTLRQSAKSGHRDISHQLQEGDDIDESWLTEAVNFDGQLAVDVFQTEKEIVIVSAVAGVRSEDLDVSMNGDMLTIRGVRRNKLDEVSNDDYFMRECFWGGFSRSIILPADIVHDSIKASLENGVLTIRLPKSDKPRNGKIRVVAIGADY
ncbi:MAG: hypothetical protein A2233_01320 [Candidatus Kerfeldbacteria bacterium RIFOXYA2_FULL_38_24]|uniref:SHSP domain-containing protein n=1 Tax=Candidatus Kerfeldbacteria bacterium RIFOXYB2_FULL_38_14 TaxID=1798547 RepID=A0A1G2BEB3_9BACT|nr:MAG: hypothetical protein A2233_01320 [Candidatus Kerfeldbacteria bacterium RIFOXYA2_FULL_38_24]OGY87375.1 MAG: hypothetical protein A2319_05410 [Candidatus Kerfeldbacteria bacterium RIFOXYB2_FULL_38_14]OGY89981.1 MAG: hypothetical protein A2458_05615 [Candidatus Kerfeldbacteria bacterium RIFOXYC2_FULL_38_9]